MWVRRALLWVKALWQTEQLNGLSPVCVLIRLRRSQLQRIGFSQTEQLNLLLHTETWCFFLFFLSALSLLVFGAGIFLVCVLVLLSLVWAGLWWSPSSVSMSVSEQLNGCSQSSSSSSSEAEEFSVSPSVSEWNSVLEFTSSP